MPDHNIYYQYCPKHRIIPQIQQNHWICGILSNLWNLWNLREINGFPNSNYILCLWCVPTSGGHYIFHRVVPNNTRAFADFVQCMLNVGCQEITLFRNFTNSTNSTNSKNSLNYTICALSQKFRKYRSIYYEHGVMFHSTVHTTQIFLMWRLTAIDLESGYSSTHHRK